MAGKVALVLTEVRLNRWHRVGRKRCLADGAAPVDLFQAWCQHEHGVAAAATGAGDQLDVDIERCVTSLACIATDGLHEWKVRGAELGELGRHHDR